MAKSPSAIRFSTQSNYHTSNWHFFEADSDESLCGIFDSEGNKNSRQPNEISREISASSLDELSDKVEEKLGRVCGRCKRLI